MMAAQNERRAGSIRMTLIAGFAAFIGPTGAVVSETDRLHLFVKDPLIEMWVLTALGALGTCIGVLAVSKGARIAGAVCILTNAAVLVLYGFIAAFFTMGGTR